MNDMRAQSYVQPASGLERPLPPRRALRPPKLAVLGVAGGALLMFGLSLVRTSDLRFLETGGGIEAADAAVPVAEPVERRVEVTPAAASEPSEREAEEPRAEVQPVAITRPEVSEPAETVEAGAPSEPAEAEVRLQPASLSEAEPAEPEPVVVVPELPEPPAPVAVEIPTIQPVAAEG
ncbi:hypothetical protein [Brevundimonas sp.]|uniref:hypothetical protein n=1 Tax=Brevundimonas sp. TaxID=1871086 RepID=UPI0025F1B4EC|nr:hypothetical protein [Brevundimonas sp.]